MRLLLDQGLPRSAAALLREAGHDAVHAGELGLAEASDQMLLDRARDEGRAVVTLDADFHALLALSHAASPSVVRLRVEGLRAPAVARLVLDVLRASAEDLQTGALVTVRAGRVRVRRLPLMQRT